VVELKFCGLTRAQDAAQAARLGARYVGVIFAGGPRLLSPDRAAVVLRAVPPDVRRVGVFAAASPEDISAVATIAELDVAQLHGDPLPGTVAVLRRHFQGQIWAVVRSADGSLPETLPALFDAADAVVLDAKVPGALGGTGVTLPWESMAAPLARARRGAAAARLVLAGGLTAENVAAAIAALAPEVVDVSSGVESAPGVKDHARMRDFASAVFATRTTDAARSIID
jgi:phosphoribosylanthranilate isomerase